MVPEQIKKLCRGIIVNNSQEVNTNLPFHSCYFPWLQLFNNVFSVCRPKSSVANFRKQINGKSLPLNWNILPKPAIFG
jgi:hypothetical protein